MTDMTIKAVRTTMIRVPWPDTPWLKGHAFGEARNLLVLEVETKGGIVGMGYLFSFRPGLKTVVAALEETILPRVIGKDATAVEGIWSDLWKATVTYNRGGIVTMAMSALDIALWDAIGKRANMPLHRLWGHVRKELPVYGSGCFRGKTKKSVGGSMCVQLYRLGNSVMRILLKGPPLSVASVCAALSSLTCTHA